MSNMSIFQGRLPTQQTGFPVPQCARLARQARLVQFAWASGSTEPQKTKATGAFKKEHIVDFVYFPHRIRCGKNLRARHHTGDSAQAFGQWCETPSGQSSFQNAYTFALKQRDVKLALHVKDLLSRAFGLPWHTQPIKGYAKMAPQEFVQFLSNSSNNKNQCKVQRVHYLHHVLITASLSIAQMESHHNGTRSCYRPAHARNMNLNNYLPLEGKGRALGFQGHLWCHESKSYSFPPVACLHGCTLGLSRTFTPTLKQAWLPPWCAYWLSYKPFGHGLLPAKGVFFQKYRLKLRRILEELHGFE